MLVAILETSDIGRSTGCRFTTGAQQLGMPRGYTEGIGEGRVCGGSVGSPEKDQKSSHESLEVIVSVVVCVGVVAQVAKHLARTTSPSI